MKFADRTLTAPSDNLGVRSLLMRSKSIKRSSVARSGEETAEVLQIPTSTVKTRLLRSRRRLQRELDPEIRDALHDTFPFAGRDCDAMTERVLQKFLQDPA
jgi:hypothetical protein